MSINSDTIMPVIVDVLAYHIENVRDRGSYDSYQEALRRRHFIMKSYGLVCLSICVTILHIILMLWFKIFSDFIQHIWVFWVAVLAYLATVMITACYVNWLKKPIVGPIVIVILVEALSLLCAVDTSAYNFYIIGLAVSGMALAFFFVIIVAQCTPIDFTDWSFGLTTSGVLLMAFVLISTIISYLKAEPILEIIAAITILFVFLAFMAYSSQMILGGQSYQYDAHQFVSAAVFVYVDVIIIFLIFLNIFGYFFK